MGIRLRNQRSIKNKISGKNLPSINITIPSVPVSNIFFNQDYKGYINEQPVPTAIQPTALVFDTATVAPSGATLSHKISQGHHLSFKMSGGGIGLIFSRTDTRSETFNNDNFAFVGVFDGADPNYSIFNLPNHNLYMVKNTPVDSFYALPKTEDAHFMVTIEQYDVNFYIDAYELNMNDFTLGNRVVHKIKSLDIPSGDLSEVYVAVGVSAEHNVANGIGSVDLRNSVGINANITSAINDGLRGYYTTNTHDGGFLPL